MIDFEISQSLVLGWFGGWEMVMVAAVFLLLFGGAKLPGLMRNMGRSVNEFKTGLKETPGDGSIEDQSEQKPTG